MAFPHRFFPRAKTQRNFRLRKPYVPPKGKSRKILFILSKINVPFFLTQRHEGHKGDF